MIITYHGVEFFKIQLGSTTLALNPVSKTSNSKSASFGANIVLMSLNHPDMNGVDSVSRGEKEPFIISGPGEYEFNNIFIRGVGSATDYEKKTLNTIYLIRMEGMNLCYLGALSSTQLPEELVEILTEVDVLFVPIGGSGVLSTKDAHKVVLQVDPKIIIPMHYQKSELTSFLKEESASDVKPVNKLALKQKDLAGKSGEVVVLKFA